MPFKTKSIKYTAIWKKFIKIVKESKPSFFYTAHNVLPTPPFSILFPSSIFFCFPSLQYYYFPCSMFLFPPLQFFIIFLPQCFLFPFTTILILSLNFIIFPPQYYYSLLFLLLLLLFLTSIVFPPPPPHFHCFDRVDVGSMWGRWRVNVGSMWGRCRVDVGSLLFSLLLLLLHIFIVFSPPKAEWAIDSEAMRARGIIVLVKSN